VAPGSRSQGCKERSPAQRLSGGVGKIEPDPKGWGLEPEWELEAGKRGASLAVV
jgi:hypothetical protein